MLPKSRKALTIQEIAALARSSLNGISQVVKDHVTKPTAMAQGRVAHLIEWKGWCKPSDSPTALESHFSSYSHLTEGEQEARFAAGVAEQFAIAEAKLRAWSSVDGEDSNDDSYDEDILPPNESLTTQSGDPAPYPHCPQDLWYRQVCPPQAPCPAESGLAPSGAPADSPDTPCSSLSSLEDHPLPDDTPSSPASPTDLSASVEGCLQGGEDLLVLLQKAEGDSASWCRGSGEDPTQTTPCCQSWLNEDREGSCWGAPGRRASRRRISDEPSSGVYSLEEDEEEREHQQQ